MPETAGKSISLWRNAAPSSAGPASGSPGASALPASGSFNPSFLFPSGRQALSFALKKLGMGRAKQVAIPEWSSQCVINAVGAYATPISMKDVLAHGIQPDAILLYEQWGWPAPKGCTELVQQKFNCPIILDKVDSPIFDGTKGAAAEIWSLSKALGLTGGGMAKIGGNFAEFKDDEGHISAYGRLSPDESSPHASHILKTDVAVVPKSVKEFVQKNGVEGPFSAEHKARRENLANMLQSHAQGYPEWMAAAHKAGAAPGIFPLYRGKQDDFLTAEKARIAAHGIATEIYHFNFTGDPLQPKYEKCLAFPIHGMITPGAIKDALKQ